MLRDTMLETRLMDDQLALFYLGQEGFLIKFRNRYILIDGYLTDYVDQHFSSEKVVWKRKYDAPIAPSELDFVDYVLCTHPHGDHADPDTLKGIFDVNEKAVFLIPYALEADLISLGIPGDRIICMDDGARVEDKENVLSIRAIPSAHEQLQKDANGHFEALGYLLKFGELTLYHAGDCCIYDGLEEQLPKIDLGLLPINGRDYYRNDGDIIGNMDSVEAIRLSEHVGIDCLIPMHYDLYGVNEVNPAYFVDCLQRINPKQKFHMFVPGERLIYMK